MTGRDVARWIAAHPGCYLICTTSREGRRYWLVHERTGEWYGVGE